MNTSKKIIRGTVSGRGFTITSPITQWDYGWQFIPEIEDLPATYRLDFSNEEKHGTALPVYCSTDGAEVPTELIDTGKDVWVWFVRIGDGFGITEYKWRVPNKCKPKTEQDEPTPTQQSSIDQLITRSNEAVESAEQSAEEADQSARSASADAERAERARTGAETAQGKAEDAQESAERAKDDAETSERNASESERKAKGYADTASEKADAITGLTATATTLPDGSSATASYDAETGVMSFGIPKGKDGTNGIDGDDGYSPTANVSKSGKTATITITDKNGTTSAQVSDGEDGATGATPNLTIGTVETLEPTESATATITGTPENPVLNLGIPQGDAGEVTLDEFYKAFPTDTASGSIASFSDGADDLPLKSLVIDINPVQDLSHGDPSPENICPISGWTEINAYNDPLYGGNIEWNQLVNSYRPGSTNGLTFVPDADNKSVSISGTITTAFSYDTITFTRNSPVKIKRDGRRYIIICNQATPYPIRVAGFADCVSVGSYGGVFSDYISEDQEFTNTLAFHAIEGDTFAISNFTVQIFDLTTMFGTEIADYIYSLERANVGAGVAWFKKLFPKDYYEYNAGKKTTVSAVNGKPYTHVNIQLGQTVYGGKLDVLSGELVIDRAMVDLGSLSWSYHVGDSFAMFFTPAINDIKKNAGWCGICSIYGIAMTNIQDIADKMISTGYGDGRIRVKDSRFTDVNSFVADVRGQTLVYELATPIEIQLSANQVNSLMGVNNIWADSGDTTCEYRADTKAYIAKKIAEAISALS